MVLISSVQSLSLKHLPVASKQPEHWWHLHSIPNPQIPDFDVSQPTSESFGYAVHLSPGPCAQTNLWQKFLVVPNSHVSGSTSGHTGHLKPREVWKMARDNTTEATCMLTVVGNSGRGSVLSAVYIPCYCSWSIRDILRITSMK